MRDNYHGGGDLHNSGGNYHQYTPVPIIRDCVGDMREERNRCICRKQYGFYKQTCSAGQQCFRGDGTCHKFQKVTCTYEGNENTSHLSAYYVATPYAQYENDDSGRDDQEPGKLVMYSGPDDDTDPLLARRNPGGGFSTDRTDFTFSFTDKGPDFDLIFTIQDFPTCELETILRDMVCTTPSGPWTAGVTDATQNGSADQEGEQSFWRRRLAGKMCPGSTSDPLDCGAKCHVMQADTAGRYVDIPHASQTDPWCMPNEDAGHGHRATEFDLFLKLRANRKRGRWTRDPKVDCQSGRWDRAASFSPYRSNNAVTCNVVEEMGLGEIGCGAMRNAGVDCCYANGANTCGFNRRCRFDGGLFVLSNNDWETQTFGSPEKNHLHDLAGSLIAGRSRVPDGSTYVAMTHSHGDDAIDAPMEGDDGKTDGEDGENDDPGKDCSPGECL